MLAVDRRKKIVEIITENKSVQVVDLAGRFEVTSETIRGDLEKLEKQGILVRTYGGATLLEGGGSDLSVSEREIINPEDKQKIGVCAAALVNDGDTIFLDASTSALWVARSIKEKKNITVITNSLQVILELANTDVYVVSVGGNLRGKTMSFVGKSAERAIRQNYYANKYFMSCRGLTLTMGLMDGNESEAAVKQAMIDCSERTIFLCDKSKLGRLGLALIGDLSVIDSLITTVSLDEQWLGVLKEKEIDVVIV